MSSNYVGVAANVAIPASVNIASSTNTAPVVVETATPHGLLDGQTVVVFGHAVNTTANGTYQITVVDATHITLIGSLTVGVGGATGTVQSAALPVYPDPSDGDRVDAVSVNVAFQALADFTASLWLMSQWKSTLLQGGLHRALSGSQSFWLTGSSATFDGTTIFSSGGTLEIDCHTTIDASRILTFSSGAEAAFASTAFISGNPTLKAGALFTIASGGTVVTWETDSILNMDSGSHAQFFGGFKVAPGGGDVTDITMSTGANIKLADRSILRMNELAPYATSDVGTGGNVWTVNRDGSASVTASTVDPLGAGVSPYLGIPIHVPNGCTLVSVIALVRGGGGHAAFPAGKPVDMLTLQVFKTQAGTSTLIGAVTDPSATAAAYEAPHTITATISDGVSDRTLKRYYAVLTSENGTNALPGDGFIDAFVTYTADHYDED